MSETPSIPAGWYPDPAGGTKVRWWDGATWTEHFDQGYQPAAALKAPEGTKTNTVWIWLIVILPILPMFGLLTINWGGMFDYDLNDPTSAYTATFAAIFSPGYFIALIGGWVVYGLCAFFAYRDWKELAAAGVPRPFHFAWVFLSSLVYVIGRSVVVRRRTGQGYAPFWGAIASIVVMFVIIIVMTILMVNGIMSQIPNLVQQSNS